MSFFEKFRVGNKRTEKEELPVREEVPIPVRVMSVDEAVSKTKENPAVQQLYYELQGMLTMGNSTAADYKIIEKKTEDLFSILKQNGIGLHTVTTSAGFDGTVKAFLDAYGESIKTKS